MTPSETWTRDWLDVGQGHHLFFSQCGPADGIPVVFLHGGPGSGCSPQHRQLFDTERFRVLMFDQRGCGRSLPRGDLQANDSDHLCADIERLRRHVGVSRWLVVGGSWGASLALAYAHAYPQACSGLLLRGVFLGRDADLEWFFQQARLVLPQAWQELAALAPEPAQGRLLHWYADGLLDGPADTAQALARAWERWEMALSQPGVAQLPPGPEDSAERQAVLLEKYRIQAHYLRHGCFWGQLSLLERAAQLVDLPSAIVHGREDLICLPQAAWALHQQLAGSRLQWVDRAGHSPFQAPMLAALKDALGHFADHGNFNDWGRSF